MRIHSVMFCRKENEHDNNITELKRTTFVIVMRKIHWRQQKYNKNNEHNKNQENSNAVH